MQEQDRVALPGDLAAQDGVAAVDLERLGRRGRGQAAIPIGCAQPGQYGSPAASSGTPVAGSSQASSPSGTGAPHSWHVSSVMGRG